MESLDLTFFLFPYLKDNDKLYKEKEERLNQEKKDYI